MLTLAFAIFLSLLVHCSATELDKYVWAADETYAWTDLGEENMLSGKSYLPGNSTWTGYTINMTSQRWLTDDVFSNSSDSGSLWWHILVVVVPNDVVFLRNASLYISGWSVNSHLPTADDEDIVLTAAIAMETKSVVGCLFQIPEEATTFSSDPIQKSRTEDAIIAFTWDHFLKDPSQPEWLLRFPMVKASLRAMDTITAFVAQKFPEDEYALDYYTVLGASKRGWTTWVVGAVDPARVMGIVPIVLDAINFVEVMHHQYKSYGGWGVALQDYHEMNITGRFDDPNMVLLQEQVDPFFYKERLTMAKLVVNAGLDEFQQPDDTRCWWSEMPEPKHFLMVPNADHSLATGILEVIPAVASWISYRLQEYTVPVFTWVISGDDGSITAVLDGEGDVFEASVWWAFSCGQNVETDGTITQRRDFRLSNLDQPCECGPADEDGNCINLKSRWTQELLEPLVDQSQRTYYAKMDIPENGRYVAFFIDIKYARYITGENKGREGSGIPAVLPGRLDFTTEVSVWPNTFPYADCNAADCYGTLL